MCYATTGIAHCGRQRLSANAAAAAAAAADAFLPYITQSPSSWVKRTWFPWRRSSAEVRLRMLVQSGAEDTGP